MRPLNATHRFICATCEVDIVARPTFHLGLPFCCAGCAADGPCTCSYDQETADDSHVRHCLDLAEPLPLPQVAAVRPAVGAARG